MSYCRWSSNNWMSDVYCYEDISDKYVTHVASNRRFGKITSLDTSTAESFINSLLQQMEDLETTTQNRLNLPHDGESFYDDTLQDFRKRVLYLKNLGYNVPAFVINDINEEIQEATKCL